MEGNLPIVSPNEYRKAVLKYAHDLPLADHLGIRKTLSRLLQYFYWPKVRDDVKESCKTCHTCQMVGNRNCIIPKSPLVLIPAVDTPRKRRARMKLDTTA